jgi:hypothetical protein
VSIRTSLDKWIKPEGSLILDGAGGLKIIIPKDIKVKETSPGNILMTNRAGHDATLNSPDIMKIIQNILAQNAISADYNCIRTKQTKK